MNKKRPEMYVGWRAVAAAACVAWIGFCPGARSAELLKNGEVLLDLRGGAGAFGAMVLAVELKDGRWSEDAWGRATGYNFGQHRGQVTVRPVGPGEESLGMVLAVVPDTTAAGGKAEYSITLKRQDNAFDGRFTGVFCDEPVSGTVRGVVSECIVRPVAGFKALEAEEHPRLIFRKSDMPELKRRMETPEGKGMMAMLTARAPLRLPSQVTDRHGTWMAANWAAVYQLTGGRDAAAEARQILSEEMVAKTLPSDRDDAQQGPRLLGAALTYDMCFDVWEEPFRRNMAELILMTAEDLYRGYARNIPVAAARYDPVPWRYRNAIKAACVGVAAMSVMKDADASGKPLADAARLARAAERDVVEWLRDGVTGTGFAMDGPLQKGIALANGVLAFMHADRVAMGRDMAMVNPMLIAGHALTGRASEDGALKLGLSSISVQSSGRWPMGFAAVPDSLRGTMRWFFDRDVGLAGKKHFDCAYPYQAAYAMVNYPFDVQPGDPAQGMPLFAADMRHGNIVFRNRWKDFRDIVAVVEFNSMSPVGADQRTGQQAGALRISGLGGEWVNEVVGVRPMNNVFGGEMLYAENVKQGQAVAGARLDPAYLVATAPGRRVEKASELAAVPAMRFVPPKRPGTNDIGIRCTRHIGIDYTGASGAPALFVIVDEMQGAGKWPWQYPVSSGARTPIVGVAAGTNLTWQFAAPIGPGKVRVGSVAADGLCFAVATLQEGKAPELKAVSASDGKVTVSIGEQTIAFNGQRIVFGK